MQYQCLHHATNPSDSEHPPGQAEWRRRWWSKGKEGWREERAGDRLCDGRSDIGCEELSTKTGLRPSGFGGYPRLGAIRAVVFLGPAGLLVGVGCCDG